MKIALKYILSLISIVFLISAACALTEGITTLQGTEVNLTEGVATFSETTTGISVSAETVINGETFEPVNTIESGDSLTWTSGEKSWLVFDDPKIALTYEYKGKQLKETIVLKEDTHVSFNLNIADNSKLVPWDNGQWKIVSATSGNTMEGIVAEKPFGVDAVGNRVEMTYAWDGASLSLEYNRILEI